jgi:fructoselysine transporter
LFSLIFKLENAIKAILAMRIIVQFIGQAIGVVLLRKRLGDKNLPFKMWLFPIPVILSIAAWIFLFFKTGSFGLYGSFIAIAAGVIVYFIKEKFRNKSELKLAG